MSFRFSGIRVFLTFPQCDRSKAVALRAIEGTDRFDCEYAVVAEEAHEDGTPHLHAVIRFKQPVTTRDCTFFDFVGGQHGNIKKITRSEWRVVSYVLKAGRWVATNGFDPVAFVSSGQKKGSTKADQIATAILEDSTVTLKSITKRHPGYVMMNMRKIEVFLQKVRLWTAKEMTKIWVPLPVPATEDWNKTIITWLNLNICKKREFKQKQLYIHGSVGVGKTHMINLLSNLIRIYHIPKSEDWDDLYEDGIYDLAVLDEFKRQKTRAYLLEWLQGSTMILKRKGLCPLIKSCNLPTIILGNYSLDVLYSDPKYHGTLPALQARLLEVYIPSLGRIDILAGMERIEFL